MDKLWPKWFFRRRGREFRAIALFFPRRLGALRRRPHISGFFDRGIAVGPLGPDRLDRNIDRSAKCG